MLPPLGGLPATTGGPFGPQTDPTARPGTVSVAQRETERAAGRTTATATPAETAQRVDPMTGLREALLRGRMRGDDRAAAGPAAAPGAASGPQAAGGDAGTVPRAGTLEPEPATGIARLLPPDPDPPTGPPPAFDRTPIDRLREEAARGPAPAEAAAPPAPDTGTAPPTVTLAAPPDAEAAVTHPIPLQAAISGDASPPNMAYDTGAGTPPAATALAPAAPGQAETGSAAPILAAPGVASPAPEPDAAVAMTSAQPGPGAGVAGSPSRPRPQPERSAADLPERHGAQAAAPDGSGRERVETGPGGLAGHGAGRAEGAKAGYSALPGHPPAAPSLDRMR